MNHTKSFDIVAGSVLILSGFILTLQPDRVFSLILDLSLGICFLNFLSLLWQYVRRKQTTDLVFSLMSLGLAVVLSRWQFLPEWFIRVAFGFYLICSSLVSAIQLFLDFENDFLSRVPGLAFLAVTYGFLGGFLLFSSGFDTDLLMQFFGLYFAVLGIRYLLDAAAQKNSEREPGWKKRRIRIMLPTVVSALLPDRFLKSINRSLARGEPVIMKEQKRQGQPQLKVMVHVGPSGFQKIGHISFAWKGIVYSYGNYDSDSFRLNGTIGDGVFFNVAIEDYIPNMMQVENNTIFEYGLLLDAEQEAKVEEQLSSLHDSSYRWYTKIERQDGYDEFRKFEPDYPSRLHYRSGAKMYKFKSGKFRTYWALGDNCASFTDVILGTLGADVLSVRGIISPGTYLDFLQTEYQNPGSPVISRIIHARTS